MNIDTKDLALCLSLADQGTLTAAARAMHLSQPALSQRLARLRERAGCELFVRGSNGLQPTAAGQRLIKAARAIHGELRQLRADLDDLAREREQRLSITTGCYTCYRWLPFVMRELLATRPELRLDVVPEATDRAEQAVQVSEVDIAIVSSPRDMAEAPGTALFDDELLAVMSDSHPLSGKSHLMPGDFRQQTLVLYAGTRYPIVEEVLRPAGVQAGSILPVRITEAIVELARAGKGIAVLAGWAFDDLAETQGLVARRITRRGFQRRWHALVGKQCPAELAAEFIGCVRQVGRRLQGASWRKQLQASAN